MYLLYVDDSGLVTDKNCQHCVLAGFAIRETQTYWVQQAIDNIVTQHLGISDIELHGTFVRTGKKECRKFPKQIREELLKAVLNYIASKYPSQFILFGVVLNKSSYQGVSLSEELFTQITSRFDMFLKRRYAKTGKGERGIAIFDKSTLEQQFQMWSQIFQKTGNHWGNTLVNFAEVPLFLDSKMSRLIQLADIIAYSLFRKYEFNDDSYFSLIQNCFDKDPISGEHGLYVH
jgi:hypothetical protein